MSRTIDQITDEGLRDLDARDIDDFDFPLCRIWKLGDTPEETIRLTIESLGMTIEKFANRGLLPRSEFERVVAGAASITCDIIEGMERVVGEDWPFPPEDDWDDEDWSGWE